MQYSGADMATTISSRTRETTRGLLEETEENPMQNSAVPNGSTWIGVSALAYKEPRRPTLGCIVLEGSRGCC